MNWPNIEGWMSPDEMDWLFETAQGMETIVEVGSWKGRSTYPLLLGCRGTVYAVDHFKGSEDERDGEHFEATVRDIYPDFMFYVGHFPNLVVIRKDSVEAAKQFKPKSIDMVFLDGDHREDPFVKDVQAWYPVCKKIFCGHDAYRESITNSLKQLGIGYEIAQRTIWMNNREAERKGN